MISSHVKISKISLISSLPLKLYFSSLVYHRNIFGSSSKVFGNLRKPSDIFENFRKFSIKKCSGTFVWPSEQFWKIFGNLRKVSKIFGKSPKASSSVCLYNKKAHCTLARTYEFYVMIARTISYSFAELSREILFLPLEHKFHLFHTY